MPGGIYHVYNRVLRGAHVFRREEEADRLEDLIARRWNSYLEGAAPAVAPSCPARR